jgi:hypothetical protein
MGAFGGTTNYPLGAGSNPVGMMGMDLSLHNMPMIGSFFQNPAELFQHEQMSRAAEAFTGYRPEYAQGKMNALANELSMIQPAQNASNALYGDMGNFHTEQALKNPMGPSMMGQGAALPSSNPNQMPGGKLGGKGLPGMGGKGG